MQKMPKKRNCRRTQEEQAIHTRAVALRKMTDHQLVEYADRALDTPAPQQLKKDAVMRVKILDTLRNTKGIGAATFAKLEAVVERVFGSETNI